MSLCVCTQCRLIEMAVSICDTRDYGAETTAQPNNRVALSTYSSWESNFSWPQWHTTIAIIKVSLWHDNAYIICKDRALELISTLQTLYNHSNKHNSQDGLRILQCGCVSSVLFMLIIYRPFPSIFKIKLLRTMNWRKISKLHKSPVNDISWRQESFCNRLLSIKGRPKNWLYVSYRLLHSFAN